MLFSASLSHTFGGLTPPALARLSVLMRRLFRIYVQRAGLEVLRVTPHTLRHTCGRRMHMAGTPVRVIQEAFGHSSVVTTQIYTGVLLEDVREAMPSDGHIKAAVGHPRGIGPGSP